MEEKICLSCGKSFVPKDKRFGKYCSLECWNGFRVRNNIQMKPRTLPDIVCTTCGKLFRPKTRKQVDADNHYCSNQCQYEAMRSKQTAVCPVCGKRFVVTCDRLKYCSKECANASRRKYTTKAEQKKAERLRYKQRCKERHREELEAASKARAVERDKKKAEREALRLAEVEKKRLAKAHECIMCGAITSRPKYCSNQCSDKAMYRRKDLARRKNLKANGPIDNSITLYALSKRDHNICHICRKPCNLDDYKIVDGTFIAGEEYPSIDHVVPVSRGGAHVWSNVRLAHRGCNSYKSAKLYLEQPNGQMMMCI